MTSRLSIRVNNEHSEQNGTHKMPLWSTTSFSDSRSISLLSKTAVDTLAELSDLQVSRIHGRDAEVRLLEQAYKNEQRPGLIVVEGDSGTGKSFLVGRVLHDLKKNRKINCMYGKFDLQRRVEPYSAITAALNDLCHQILSKEDERQLDSLRSMLETDFGGQEKVLTSWNPNLEPVFHKKTTSEPINPDNLGLLEERNRLLFLLRKFIRVMCHFYSPVLVLFVDDLQWADTASLDILESLATDGQNKNLLVIGTERKHGREENGKMIKNLRASGATVEIIKLRNLDFSGLNSLLSDALRSEKEHTAKFAEIVHRKTHGNPFFVMQFLQTLKEKKILRFNLSLVQWQWENELVDELMHVTDNVTDLLRKMLITLYPLEKFLLQVAACLGSRFCLPTLHIGLKALQKVEKTQLHVLDEAGLSACMESLVSFGLLERLVTPDPQYRFVHDQILSSAYQLIPAERKDAWNLTIGEAMIEMEQEESDAGYLFLTTDLCNGGLALIGNDPEKRSRIYYLNYRSGKKAMTSSGYLAAASYFTTAILLQDHENRWKKQLYKTTLDLYSSFVECAYCLGQFEQMQQHADEIILNDAIPLEDKLRAYLTIHASLNARSKYEEMFDLAISLFNRLGIGNLPYSVRAFHVIGEFIKTAKLAKRFSTHELENLPLLQPNSIRVYATGLMDLMSTGLYLTNPKYLSFMTFRHVQDCLKHGVGEFSPSAFAFYGVFLCGKRFDLSKGCEQGKLALKILDRVGSKRLAARTIFLVHGFIYHWTSPVYSMLKPSLEGYRIGMQNGDIENAMFNLQSYCIFSLHAAIELNSLEVEMRKFVKTMEDFKQDGVRNITALFWQQALNLMDHPSSRDHLVLTGDAMNEAHMVQVCHATKNSAILCQIYDLKMQLAYLFSAYDLLPELLHQSDGLEVHMLASAMHPRHVFYRGMVCYALARHHVNSGRLRLKWLGKGSHIAKRIAGFSRAGNMNCVHMVDLLAAERMALTGRIREAKRLYGVAIALSSRNGFLQDRALAHERAAISCLDHKDLYWASHHFEQAHGCYESWGAKAKANHLREKYREFCDHGIFSSSVLESQQS